MALTEEDLFSKSHCLLFMNEKQEQMISFLMNMISIYRSLSVNTVPKRAKSNLAHACPVSIGASSKDRQARALIY